MGLTSLPCEFYPADHRLSSGGARWPGNKIDHLGRGAREELTPLLAIPLRSAGIAQRFASKEGVAPAA